MPRMAEVSFSTPNRNSATSLECGSLLPPSTESRKQELSIILLISDLKD